MMDNTKKVVRKQADVSQGDKLLRELAEIIADCSEGQYISSTTLMMKLNSYIHRRDNKMFNQGYKTAEKEMGERRDENT